MGYDVFFAMNFVFLLVGLLALTQPGRAIYCHVTSETTSADTYFHPTTRVALYIPGTWTVFNQPGVGNFYRSLFTFTNSSNGALMHHRSREPAVSTLAGGTKRILFYFNYHPQDVGPVRIQYTELPHQPVRFLFNGTAYTEMDITCTTRNLNVLHAATRHGGTDVIIRFARPVKRCDQNTTKLLSNSWFAYSTTSCATSAPNCLAAQTIGPCNTTTDEGFVPVEGTNDLQWRCKAHSNFSSDATYTNYNILVDRICDAWDNHSVNAYGAADDDEDPTTLKLLPTISSVTPVFYMHPNLNSVYHHNRVYVDTVWPVLVSNLTAARPKLLIKYNTGMSNARCTAISDGKFAYDSIISYDCTDTWGVAVNAYDTSVRAILEGPSNYFYHLSSTVEVEASSVTDKTELDEGASPIITYHFQVLGLHYLSRNQVLLFINHDWTSSPDAPELIFYDDTGVQYNVTNVTRRSPNSYYANFDTDNQLPVDYVGSGLKGYFVSYSSADPGYIPKATVMAVTEYAVPSTSDVTLNDIDNMGVKVVIYISFAVTGLVGLYFIYRVIQHGCPKGMRSTRSSKRRG